LRDFDVAHERCGCWCSPLPTRFYLDHLLPVYCHCTAAGLFFFDSSFRPVPLALDFVGVTVNNFAARNTLMTEICYNKVRQRWL